MLRSGLPDHASAREVVSPNTALNVGSAPIMARVAKLSAAFRTTSVARWLVDRMPWILFVSSVQRATGKVEGCWARCSRWCRRGLWRCKGGRDCRHCVRREICVGDSSERCLTVLNSQLEWCGEPSPDGLVALRRLVEPRPERRGDASRYGGEPRMSTENCQACVVTRFFLHCRAELLSPLMH